MTIEDDPWQEMGLFSIVKPETAKVRFMVPTFPGPEMFVHQLDHLETLLRWYDVLKQVLERQSNVLVLVDDHNLIRFPATVPWDRWPATVGCCVDLAAKHQACCRLLRQLVLYQASRNRAGSEATQHQLLVDLTGLIHTVRGMVTPLPDQLVRFTQAHHRWVTDFEAFLDRLMKRGVASWDRVEAAGNFRLCELGQAFYRPEGMLWHWRHLSLVRDLEQLHKDFHATVAVEASIATTLRSYSLTAVEQLSLQQTVQQKLAVVRDLSHQLVQCMDAAFLEIRQSKGVPQPFVVLVPERTTLSRVVAQVEMWQTRIERFIGAPFDPAIDKILLHTTCPTGQRIDRIMDDPIRLSRHAPLLDQVDTLHRNQHATAARIVAWVRQGQPDQARMLLNKLEQDCRRLIGFMQQFGVLLDITPDTELGDVRS
ncbi:MAG: hypothetical protein HQL58_11765 [Magnetococcales bacterium]|nr:hypothetical protein [Magnetococcales bacterium]